MATFSKFFESTLQRKGKGENVIKHTGKSLAKHFVCPAVQTWKNSSGPKSNVTNRLSRRLRRRQHDGPEQSILPPQKRFKKTLSEAERKYPPCKVTIDLSEKLKNLSRQKRVEEAFTLYGLSQYDAVRDSHHACILVDCCARVVGPTTRRSDRRIVQAERIIANLENPNVEVLTALMKLYTKAGVMDKAHDLFTDMCRSPIHPNVRTLNTLFRGCLATPVIRDAGKSYQPIGGVVTSEVAWKVYHLEIGSHTLDTSSYEYSIVLLCQALNLVTAQERIEAFQAVHNIRIKGKATFVVSSKEGLSADVFETIAISFLSLSRAYAILGRMEDMWIGCQRALSAIQLCRKGRTEDDCSKVEEMNKEIKASFVKGGKRGWKSASVAGSEEQNFQLRRLKSNVVFRTHRLNEIEFEALGMLKIRRDHQKTDWSHNELWKRLSKNLFIFPPCNNQNDIETSASFSSTACWHSFGGESIGKIIGFSSAKELRHRDAIRDDGTLNFDVVFDGNSKYPLDIELGSGFGDWIVQSAAAHPNRRHVAVESKMDRVCQIFTKGILQLISTTPGSIGNLCVVGSDAGSFLRYHVQSSSTSTIFVNHPEPPTQTFGSRQEDLDLILNSTTSDIEPAHMLRSETLEAAFSCLIIGGRLVIVTDNRNYGQLVCATASKVMRAKPAMIRRPSQRELVSAGLRGNKSMSDHALLYERHPSRTYPTSVDMEKSTWFDRMWKEGASVHAEQHIRFVILLYRSG